MSIRYSRRHQDEVIQLYVEDELSLTEIEEATGMKANTAYHILRRRSVPRRSTGYPAPPIPTPELERTVWLHRQGLTYEQVGEILDLSEGGVKHRINVARKRLGYRETNRGRNGRTRAPPRSPSTSPVLSLCGSPRRPLRSRQQVDQREEQKVDSDQKREIIAAKRAPLESEMYAAELDLKLAEESADERLAEEPRRRFEECKRKLAILDDEEGKA